LAYLDGPDGRYMGEVEWKCLRAALEEMIDEHGIWLLEKGVDVREKWQPRGWSLERLEAYRKTSVTWVEKL